jgi:Cu/Ag efflux protein CusF
MKSGSLLFAIVSVVFSGCAAYRLEPLSMNHPANPEATAVVARPVSKTLAYTRADIPSSVPTSAMMAQQHGEETQQSAQSEQKTVVADGKVVATVPNASQLVVEHGEIKGFMEAMTMGYRVDPPSLLEGLKFGDKVRFTIDVPKKAIVKIEKLN